MNDMMKMNGDMKDMGMEMSYHTMDMNQVMYPEIIAENNIDAGCKKCCKVLKAEYKGCLESVAGSTYEIKEDLLELAVAV